MRYIDLMGGQKPHLLVKTDQQSGRRDEGAATRRRRGSTSRTSAPARPWITRLPFPVHVVERVETYDRVSRNRFVTRYAYHHGYFDGVEREFRGFGMVEQWDTEELNAITGSDLFSDAANSTRRPRPALVHEDMVSYRHLCGRGPRLRFLRRPAGRG